MYPAAGRSGLLAPSPSPSPGAARRRSAVLLRWCPSNIFFLGGRGGCKVYNRITAAPLCTAIPADITTHLLPRAREPLGLPGFLSRAAECTIVSVIREATSHSACCLRVSRFFSGFNKFCLLFLLPTKTPAEKTRAIKGTLSSLMRSHLPSPS